MANEKKITTRIQQKHDTKANWEKATNFEPKEAEIVVYDDLKKIKIGHNNTKVNDLSFLHVDWNELDSKPTSLIRSDDVILGTPVLPPDITKIPTHLSDLKADSDHMTVSQVEKDNWNSKSSGSSSGGVGTSDHSLLINRNRPNQHSIEAITNLQQVLDEKLTEASLSGAINTALAQAKASGEFKGEPGADGAAGYTPIKGVDYFDGKNGTNGKNGRPGRDGTDGAPGQQGPAGADGKTPKKGVDYWTESDKQEIIDSVLLALPKAKGVEF